MAILVNLAHTYATSSWYTVCGRFSQKNVLLGYGDVSVLIYRFFMLFLHACTYVKNEDNISLTTVRICCDYAVWERFTVTELYAPYIRPPSCFTSVGEIFVRYIALWFGKSCIFALVRCDNFIGCSDVLSCDGNVDCV